MMTNKDRTGTARQRARRQREKEWLAAHGFTSWEQLHTKLMNGEIALDRVTPNYSRPNLIEQAMERLQQGSYPSKKDKQS